MVQINRSNIAPRRIRGPHGGGAGGDILSRIQSFADSIPQLSRLSPLDRMLVFVGATLLGVVSFSYFFLISGIFSSSPSGGSSSSGGSSFLGLGGGSSSYSDPRFSSALKKTGLSDEALRARGGGRRIRVGPRDLDAEENAVALDIIKTLGCDALQDEMEREWHAVLDGKKLAAEEVRDWEEQEKKWKEEEGAWGNGGGEDGGVGGDAYEPGMMDDFAGELANEIEIGGGLDGWSGGEAGGSGDGNERLDDFVNRRRSRRLEDLRPDDDGMRDYGDYPEGAGSSYEPANRGLRLTGRHLFCLAAEGITLPRPVDPASPGPSAHCDVNSFDVRDELLYLWSSARSQMPENVLIKTLKLITEHEATLRGREVHVWHPDGDMGTEGMLRVLNSGYEGRLSYNFDSEPADVGHDGLYRFHDLPSKFVGPNKLFVDVGSALGLTSMLIAHQYPGTSVVSIEPAAPSWLIQNINFRCNLSQDQLQYIHPVLAGVGNKHHDDNDSMMKMVWRPSMTTATRNWNPKKDFDYASDIELLVHLRTLRAILAEATPEDLPIGTPISVLNLDCEGCEYNLIPSLHDTSFGSIGLIMGRTNWGYIPMIKKPSSDRARRTHERLCGHYNFAKRCKECCEFPSMTVRPRLRDGGDEPGQGEHTVAEVAGDMCNGFEEWAEDQKLRDVPDDFGWNDMSAFAPFS